MKNGTRIARYALIGLFGFSLLFTAGVVGGWIDLEDDYTITRRVVGVPYEDALVEYCQVLDELEGVTGVSYKDYNGITGSALVTVRYNPELTSPKILMVWLGNTKSIWERPVIA